jgi:transcriptional regulator with XRE-family HTH domain
MTIHSIVRQTRASNKQEYFAFMLGISQGYLCNIERGRRKPSIETLKRLSELTDLTFTELIILTYGTN